MWLRVLLSILIWWVFKPKTLGINIHQIQHVLSCPNVIVDHIEQKGYGFSLQLKGSGIGDCLQDSVAFCRLEEHFYYCHLMDNHMAVIWDNSNPGDAL